MSTPAYLTIAQVAERLPVELKDRWQEPELWYRANPSLGITLDFDTFKSRAEEAQNQTSKLNSFLRYRMNMWTQNKVAAFSIQIWNRGAVPGLNGAPSAVLPPLSSGKAGIHMDDVAGQQLVDLLKRSFTWERIMTFGDLSPYDEPDTGAPLGPGAPK